MTPFNRAFLLVALPGLLHGGFAAAAGAKQQLYVKGSVVNQARAGATSSMEIANAGSVPAQQTVHVKGSVINDAAGRRKRSSVAIASK